MGHCQFNAEIRGGAANSGTPGRQLLRLPCIEVGQTRATRLGQALQRKPCGVGVVEGDAAGGQAGGLIQHHHGPPAEQRLRLGRMRTQIADDRIHLWGQPLHCIQTAAASVTKIIHHHVPATQGCHLNNAGGEGREVGIGEVGYGQPHGGAGPLDEALCVPAGRVAKFTCEFLDAFTRLLFDAWHVVHRTRHRLARNTRGRGNVQDRGALGGWAREGRAHRP